MQKINIEGIDRDLLTAFVTSRYWRESTLGERMAAVPGGVNPFDVIPQEKQSKILEAIQEIRNQNQDYEGNNAALMLKFQQYCTDA